MHTPFLANLMPDTYNIATRQYLTSSGIRSRREVRELLEKLLDHTKGSARTLATQYDDGEISITEFEAGMRSLLKSSHLVSASIGRGGRARMTAKDWGRVGNKIRWQFGYLSKFARRLANGMSKSMSESRAASYSAAIYTSYADSVAETRSEWKDAGYNQGKDPQVRLVQASQEGCVECNSDAAEGWMDESSLAPLFSRICGDFCLCEIEWQDDEGL